METIIIIQERYLIFRDQAESLKDVLEKKIKTSQADEIYLDFSKVIFASRSFTDEFLNILFEFALNKKHIKLINQRAVVKFLFTAVKKTKEKIRKELFRFSHK